MNETLNVRPTPARGEFYKHFKGTDYKVIIVTRVDGFRGHYEAPTHWAKHTETGQTLGIWYQVHGDAAWATLDDELVRDRLVIYFSASKQPGLVWARPLDNFLEMISIPTKNNMGTVPGYRFEKIEGVAQ